MIGLNQAGHRQELGNLVDSGAPIGIVDLLEDSEELDGLGKAGDEPAEVGHADVCGPRKVEQITSRRFVGEARHELVGELVEGVVIEVLPSVALINAQVAGSSVILFSQKRFRDLNCQSHSALAHTLHQACRCLTV
ncbi:hypothetical protein [Mycolicibacterium vanbaalenii]|uniref:hypothetical protein n=1 Tax=Mycolicibacterium vanbaalenii TaxID=110539 RepID=UPI001F439B29|nr:hypothetical protein [Mycolicibacterium vanbaalenii]